MGESAPGGPPPPPKTKHGDFEFPPRPRTVPDKSNYRSHVKVKVRWSDEGSGQFTNDHVFFTLLEEARLHYFLQLKLLPPSLKLPFTLLNTAIRFFNPGRGGVEVVCDIKTIKLGRSSFTQRYRIREVLTGQVWCQADAVLVGWDVQEKHKRDMTQEFRNTIADFEGLSREVPPRKRSKL